MCWIKKRKYLKINVLKNKLFSKMKKIFLIIPLLLLQFMAFSQWRKVEKLPKEKMPNVKLAYWGNWGLKYPGLLVGGEFNFRRRSVTIKGFERTKENYFALNFLSFNEADLKRGIGFSTTWLKRTTYQHSGIFTELNLGVGYVRDATIRPTTYLKNPDGSETIKSATKDYFMITIGVGAGYDFMPKTNLPIKAYVQTGLSPFTDLGSLLQLETPKLEVGVVTSLSIFKKK
jgi:hypothetical protein